MKTFVKNSLIALLGTTIGLSACSKEGKGEDKPISTAIFEDEPSPASDTAPSETPEDAHFALGMMNSYEKCRTLLADDKTEGIADCANGIAEASKTSHASAPEAAHEHIGVVVQAAKALAATSTEDIETIRLSFGELSKAIVGMLASAPEAAKNYHVFECPMAKGYKRWAQPTEELANPYKGQDMLTCGSEVHDIHEGMKDGDTEHGGHNH